MPRRMVSATVEAMVTTPWEDVVPIMDGRGTSTPASTPAEAGPWMCAAVGKPESPATVIEYVKLPVLLS